MEEEKEHHIIFVMLSFLREASRQNALSQQAGTKNGWLQDPRRIPS